MAATTPVAALALNHRFFTEYPLEAAKQLESFKPEKAAGLLARQPVRVLLPLWEYLTPDVSESLLPHLPETVVRQLLSGMDPGRAATLLHRLTAEMQTRYLSLLDKPVANELRGLMGYSVDSAGNIMDPRIVTFRGDMTARGALSRLRSRKPRVSNQIFLVDDHGRLTGWVGIQALALAEPGLRLDTLAQPVAATVPALSSRDEVVELLEQHKLTELPVVDFENRLIGVIHHAALVTALQEEASVDIQTMVGASKDERALSKANFAVRKRLPWLQINLLTAFLAASVVGLFEGTIAKFTALAVLLPVVAGQSGNAGAQALAVTMRGLALREISMRHWLKVVIKEVNVGFLNGVAIALTTAAGVYVWSRSYGLALVIGSAMVIAMVAAGFSGALIPILLTRFGQDPAQSSSIILTTVTDVVGFFSFLGIATLLATLL